VQVATVIATVLPLWESRTAIMNVIINTVTCSPADPDAMKVSHRGCRYD
jgi:hypothetical protein